MAASISRRGILQACGAGMAAAAALRGHVSRLPTRPQVVLTANGPAVASVHNDQPWHDFTGHAEPYHPPEGLRSAEPVAELGEEAVRRLQYSI